MKKKMSGKEVFGGVLAVVVALIFIVYMLVYRDYKDRTDRLVEENKALKEEVDAMKQYYDEMPIYIQESNDMIAAMNDMIKDFPADAHEEEGIMMAVAMQTNAAVNFENVNIAGNTTVHYVPQELVDAAAVESIPFALDFRNRAVSYENITNYENLRSCIKTVYDSANRIGVRRVSYKTEKEVLGEGDDTVTLTVLRGTIDVSFFNLAGTDKVYVPPVIPEYVRGTSNIFGYNIVNNEGQNQ